MTEREARIAFNMIPTVGAVTLARLVRETHGSAAAAYCADPANANCRFLLLQPETESE